MKKLSYKKVSKLLKYYRKRGLIEASVGLFEDWFWTAGTIFAGYKIKRDYNKNAYTSSVWATPVLMLEFKNGKTLIFECSKGKSKPLENPFIGAMGTLSKPMQERLEGIGISNYPLK